MQAKSGGDNSSEGVASGSGWNREIRLDSGIEAEVENLSKEATRMEFNEQQSCLHLNWVGKLNSRAQKTLSVI